MSAINLNNLSVDANGRVSFSGLSSGIDFKGAVDAIIAAKRIPIDRLEATVTANTIKIAALKDLKTNLNALKESVSKLYGAISFGDDKDIFENKKAFASTSRLDGVAASLATALIGVSVTNAAAKGNHTIQVLQTAVAHKVSSDTQTSTSTALGFADGDAFTVEGQTITVAASDTLLDLRDRINNANTGTTPTGVTASIISVSATENYLMLTKDETGASMTLADNIGTPLGLVGVLTGASIKNELQVSQTALLYADGVLDQTNLIYESNFQSANTVAVGSDGELTFTRDSDSFVLGTIAYSSADTIQTLADNINAGGFGVTASIVTDGAGVRLEITGGVAFTISESDPGAGLGTAIVDLGIDNKRRAIERTTNTIDDLFAGVTLSLFQAEKGTTIKIEIERDLTAVKTELTNFVDAYNSLKVFYNNQRDTANTTDDTAGILFGSRALGDINTSLGTIVGQGVTGVGADFSVLAQIGIGFIDNNALDDPLNANTLEINESELDDALLNNSDDVRRLLGFNFTPSDSRITLLGFTGKTTYNSGGYTLNVQPVDPATANIDGDASGADDGSVTITGNVIQVDTGNSTGLRLLFSGFTVPTAVQLDFTVGLGVELFFAIDAALATTTGIVEAELTTLADRNVFNEERIEDMLTRLEIQRKSLLERFIKMEITLATANRILDSIRQTTSAMLQDR